jgi:phospholipid N-methyltransferase
MRQAPRSVGRSDWGLFLTESFRSFSTTASVLPSSKHLASAMLRPIDFERASVIVELGVGTGAVTLELLNRMRPDARLYALDINARFIEFVRETIHDPRLAAVVGAAEDLGDILQERGERKADAIISSLGLTTMRGDQRERILREMRQSLAQGGVVSQFQYWHSRGGPRWMRALGLRGFPEEEFLRQYFHRISTNHVLRNFPPATVYSCRFATATGL